MEGLPKISKCFLTILDIVTMLVASLWSITEISEVSEVTERVTKMSYDCPKVILMFSKVILRLPNIISEEDTEVFWLWPIYISRSEH